MILFYRLWTFQLFPVLFWRSCLFISSVLYFLFLFSAFSAPSWLHHLISACHFCPWLFLPVSLCLLLSIDQSPCVFSCIFLLHRDVYFFLNGCLYSVALSFCVSCLFLQTDRMVGCVPLVKYAYVGYFHFEYMLTIVCIRVLPKLLCLGRRCFSDTLKCCCWNQLLLFKLENQHYVTTCLDKVVFFNP